MIPARVLGAYPGDAVPIEEAGNPNGLFGLASRYGYGDWSDDYDDDDSDEGLTGMNSHRRSRHGSRRRLRRPTSAQSVSSGKSANSKTRRSSTQRSRRRRSSSASGSRRRGHTDSFSSNTGWDDIFGSDNRSFAFGGFTSSTSSRQQSRAIPARPMPRSDNRDANAPVTPSMLAEMRRSAASNTIVRRPMERTAHEKEKDRQHSS